jgi:hypothetical protein
MKLTNEHLKLLYLIGKYSRCAKSKDEKDQWIRYIFSHPTDNGGCTSSLRIIGFRRLPLLVLIYELTVDGIFDYDYAPVSELIGIAILCRNSTTQLHALVQVCDTCISTYPKKDETT